MEGGVFREHGVGGGVVAVVFALDAVLFLIKYSFAGGRSGKDSGGCACGSLSRGRGRVVSGICTRLNS